MRKTACFDSYAWAEYFQGTSLGKKIAGEWIDGEAIVATPSIALTELDAKSLKEGKSFENHIQFILGRGPVLSIDVKISRRAAKEKAEHKLGTVDALIYATAVENNLELVTGDEHLVRLPNVVNVKKI